MYKEIFKNRIKEARLKANLTQKEVAELTGYPQSSISLLESGKIEPEIETLCKLIDLYEVSANWVLGTGQTLRN